MSGLRGWRSGLAARAAAPVLIQTDPLPALDQKAIAKAAQMTFLLEVDAQESEAQLLKVILQFGCEHRQTTRRDIVEHIVMSCWGQWHTREVNKAVGGIISCRRLNREKDGRGHIDTDRLTFV